MTFGFPAYHTETFSTTLSPEQLRLAVLTALNSLKWRVKSDTPAEIQAVTSINVFSSGEKVSIQFFQDGIISVTSKCAMPTQCLDWGKNKTNVQNFVNRISR